jgi:hypothetical protein
MNNTIKKIIKTKPGQLVFGAIIAPPLLAISLAGAFLIWFGAHDEI